jgi:hypothetical protein
MHSVATFSVCFRGLSRLDDDDDFGRPCVFSSSCCTANKRPNSATLAFSRFAGVPVRVRERAWSYRAFLLLPKGPVSSGGLRGLRDSLWELSARCIEKPSNGQKLTLCRRNPRARDCPSRLARAPLVARSGIPWRRRDAAGGLKIYRGDSEKPKDSFKVKGIEAR